MRLYFYYALHSFKNQLKKLFKTWVLIFLAVCLLVGMVIGGVAAIFAEPSEEPEPEGPSFFEELDMDPGEFIELVSGGVVLLILLIYAVSADKNGSRIFLPADVNLLFPSPMKPQSVLLFRLANQLGAALVGGLYMLIQVPNLVNIGLSVPAALALAAGWVLTTVFGTLLEVLLYTLSSTHPSVKRFLRPAVYGVVLVIGGGFALYASRSGKGLLQAAVGFFNAPITRFIPIWGWIKGFCAFAVQGSVLGVTLCLLALLLTGAGLIYIIWNIRADFYEDALAQSQETAELLEAAQSEKSYGILVKRKKDRSEKLRRDGLRHGSGANVFFCKTLYNRFRFAHLGVFTKTMEFYLAAAAGIALFCKLAAHTRGLMPAALALAVFSFFRSLGNPLERDTNMDCFLLIPESTRAKLFWSLMGGTASCLLDVLPAVLAAALIAGESLLAALLWAALIVSVDFYATNVGAFIGFSVPVSAGKVLKQVVQIMFVYFGLLPDIAFAAAGIVSGHVAAGMLGAALFNCGLGFLFFALSPRFLDFKK